MCLSLMAAWPVKLARKAGSWQSGSDFVRWVGVCGPHLLGIRITWCGGDSDANK